MYVLWFIEIYQPHVHYCMGQLVFYCVDQFEWSQAFDILRVIKQPKQPENVMGFSGVFDCLIACGVM